MSNGKRMGVPVFRGLRPIYIIIIAGGALLAIATVGQLKVGYGSLIVVAEQPATSETLSHSETTCQSESVVERQTAVAVVQAGALAGRVLCQGRRVAGAQVHAELTEPAVSATCDTQTDGEGCFSVPLANATRCWITASTHSLFGTVGVELPRKDSGTPVEVVLKKEGSISGRVVDKNGHPVVGARVDAAVYLEQGLVPAVTTDAGGHFEMVFPWADEYETGGSGPFVRARKDNRIGYFKFSKDAKYWKDIGRSLKTVSPESPELVGTPCVSGVVITIDEACAIDGTVTDSHGRPQSNTMVLAQCQEAGIGSTRIQSDATGSFHFEGLLPGHYAFAVERKDIASEIPFTWLSYRALDVGEQVTDMVLAVQLSDADAVGRVIDVDGRAIEKASVTLELLGPRAAQSTEGLSTLSDSTGSFSFRHLYPGEYKMRVSSPSYIEHVQLVHVDTRTESRIVTLVQSPVISGRIVDEFLPRCPDDAALEVYAGDSLPPTAAPLYLAESSLGSDGHFSLVLPDQGTFTLRATADGYETAQEVVRIHSGESRDNVVLSMNPCLPLSGYVCDAQRVPVASATLHFVREGVPGKASCYTEKDGRFTVSGLTRGVYRVTALRTEGPRGTGTCTVEPGEDLGIVMSAFGSVSGSVQRKGVPVDGWQVRLTYSDEPCANLNERTTMGIRNGKFTMSQIPPGEYELLVEDPSATEGGALKYLRKISVDANRETHVSLELPESCARLSGKAYVNGVATKGVTVFLSSPGGADSGNYIAGTETDDTGSYELRSVPSGKVVVCASFEGSRGGGVSYCARRFPLDLVEGTTNTQDFELTQNGTLVFQVAGLRKTDSLDVLLLPEGMGWQDLEAFQTPDQYLVNVMHAARAPMGEGVVQMLSVCPGRYTAVALASPNQSTQASFLPGRDGYRCVAEQEVEVPDGASPSRPVTVTLSGETGS